MLENGTGRLSTLLFSTLLVSSGALLAHLTKGFAFNYNGGRVHQIMKESMRPEDAVVATVHSANLQ